MSRENDRRIRCLFLNMIENKRLTLNADRKGIRETWNWDLDETINREDIFMS